MKTLTLLTLWAITRLAWELARHTDATSRFEPLLSDVSVMAETDARDSLSAAVKKWAEA